MKDRRFSIVFLFFAVLSTALLPSGIRWVALRIEERLPDTFSLDRIALDIQGEKSPFAMPRLMIQEGQEFRYLGHGDPLIS